MTCSRAIVLDLLRKDEDWLQAFQAFCQAGPLRLRSQARQIREALEARGEAPPSDERDLEDALFALARDLLPESAAAQWDAEWAGELCRVALDELAGLYASVPAEKRAALDLSPLRPWEDEIVAAGVAEDRAGFRTAVEGFGRVGAAVIGKALADTTERGTHRNATQPRVAPR